MVNGDDPKLEELERLLNDPEVPMQAARVWELLAEISGASAIGMRGHARSVQPQKR